MIKTKQICHVAATLTAGLALMGQFALAHDPLHGGHDHEPNHGVQSEQFLSTDAHAPVALAQARERVRRFRETGDDRYLDAAWAGLQPAVHNRPSDADLLIVAATIAQARHEFSRALEFLAAARAMRLDDPQALLLEASIHLVQGNSAAAKEACRRLHKVSLLLLLTCNARTTLPGGKATRAYSALVAALAHADSSSTNPEHLAWSHGVVGDLAAASNLLHAAADHYRASLALAERAQVRAALVDVLLSAGHDDEAWRVVRAGSDALPLLIRKFIVARRLDRLEELAGEVAQTDARFTHWIDEGDWLHAREMARFYFDVLERPRIAGRLAVVNLELQKEAEDWRLFERARRHR